MSNSILKEEIKICTFNRIVRVIKGRTRDYFLLLQILQIKLPLNSKKKAPNEVNCKVCRKPRELV